MSETPRTSNGSATILESASDPPPPLPIKPSNINARPNGIAPDHHLTLPRTSPNLKQQRRRVSSAATAQRHYQQASSLFVTRQFPQTLLTLRPVLDSQDPTIRTYKTKAWILYCALLDAANDETDENGRSQWGKAEWRNVKRLAVENEVWEEADKSFGQHANIANGVLKALLQLALKHSNDSKYAQRQAESALVACTLRAEPAAAYKEIRNVYLTEILLKSRDWELANQYVENDTSFSEDGKKDMLDTLEKLKRKTAAADAELQREREAKTRVAAAKKEQAERQSASRSNKSRRSHKSSSSASGTSPPRTTERQSSNLFPSTNSTNPDASSNPVNNDYDDNQLEDAARSANSAERLIRRYWSSLTRLSRYAALFRSGLFFVLLVVALARRQVRERVQRWMRLAYIKVAQTIGMGMNVTYL